MSHDFTHQALDLTKDRPLVYTAMSKHIFYFRMFISKFVFEQGAVPLNPFMTFDYFLLDTINRDVVREGNNNLVKRADEVWVFGPVSNGVLAEVKIARTQGKPVKYFKIVSSKDIVPTEIKDVELEPEVAEFRAEL